MSKRILNRAKPSGALEEILAVTRTRSFRDYIEKLLIDLCRIDTTPKPDVSKMRRAEAACFAILEKELKQLGFSGAHLERRPINPAIQAHPSYSLLHYTKTAQNPAGLAPEQAYHDRANLVFVVPGTRGHRAGQSVALNAHIDVVPPYFPPRLKNGTVVGRGACDDKGPVVAIVAALKALSLSMPRTAWKWNRNVVAMFVVEEETGGNGSLSLATDRTLKKLYDSALVCECTGLKIYPANRGAVWYRAVLRKLRGVSLLEMFAFINEELEKEGASIRTESHHPLFPHRPVQTCHGIVGGFGEHPSRICGRVSFDILLPAPPTRAVSQLIEDCLENGLANYVSLYGDKTKVVDAATNKPMVHRHYLLKKSRAGFQIEVYGATGHMGAIRERDGAITKTAHLVRGLVYSKRALEKFAGGKINLRLTGHGEDRFLVLEGGQGFVPTHRIEEVMERLRQAAIRGAESYLRRGGRSESGEKVVSVTYEKLHNDAFDGDPTSLAMRNAVAAARDCGLWKEEPIQGWTVSCDARLFAKEYPGMPVLTFGPGKLVHAHSDQEQIDLREIQAAAEFLALFLLRQTGTCPGDRRTGAGRPRAKTESG